MLQHPRASNRGAAIPLESNRGAAQCLDSYSEGVITSSLKGQSRKQLPDLERGCPVETLPEGAVSFGGGTQWPMVTQ